MSWHSRQRKALARAQRRYEKERGWKDWPLKEAYRRLEQEGCRCVETAMSFNLNGRHVMIAPALSITTNETIGRARSRVTYYHCAGCERYVIEDEAAHTCSKCKKLIDIDEKCETCRGDHLSLVP